MIHSRIDCDGFYDGPGNDMRERDLAVPLCGEVLIDDAAIFFEDLYGNRWDLVQYTSPAEAR